MASNSRLLLLRRGDHDSRLTEGFESLLERELMTDVSITCGQQILKAHRTVLSIFSPFFRRVFDSITNPVHYPVVVLKDMPYSDLRAIVDLMYRGEVTVSKDQFPSLKESAKVLEVSELSDIITSYEEKNDIKFKVEDSITSSGRTTRKRGRPRRYCEEESDEEYKVLETPSTKRQQTLAAARSAASTSSFTTTTRLGSALNKPQTATRGGANALGRQPTATRGAYSAFTKPQTATRGGTAVKPQMATRGAMRGTSHSRGRGTRNSEDKDEDFDPSQEYTGVRRRGRGRPSRTQRPSREDKGLPMATNLPVSLPDPIEGVDIRNIFENMNDVSSTSITAPPGAPMPAPFEVPIKLEPDSDSEVECIMSGTSPLPSGVLDEGIPEITETQETSTVPGVPPNPEPSDRPVDQSTSVANPEPTPEQTDRPEDPETSRCDPNINETEVTPGLLPPVAIKTERPDTPVADVSQTSATQSSVAGNESAELLRVTTTQIEPGAADPVSQTSSSTNDTTGQMSIPLIRRIKSERITPTNEDQSGFQPIANSSDQTDSEPRIETTIPVRTRIKTERISPTTATNEQTIDLSADDSNQLSNDNSAVSSSHKEPTVGTSTSDHSIHSGQPSGSDVCTSSSQQSGNELQGQQNAVEGTEQDLDVQEIGFEFYSNDQQMQTFGSEANSSSVTFSASNVSSFVGFNPPQDINHQNNQQFIPSSTNFSQITETSNQMTYTSTPTTLITTSDPSQQTMIADNSSQQFFGVNTTQQMTSTTNAYPLDNNIVMNSPIHSDEECMLLDSPQQSGTFEVTIGAENSLDDSMDNI